MFNNEASSVVNGNLVIDWSIGPNDAQYYTQDSASNYESFAKIENGVVYFVTGDDWKDWNIDLLVTPDELLDDDEMIKKGV